MNGVSPTRSGMVWISSDEALPGCYLDRKGSRAYSGDKRVELTIEDEAAGSVGYPRAWPQIDTLFGLVSDKRVGGAPLNLGFKPKSLDRRWLYQEPAIKRVVQACQTSPHGGATLVAPCGVGKTVMLVAIACELGRATLVVVHTEELLEQWVERITEYTGCTRDHVGVVRGDSCPRLPFCVGLLQSLSRRDYGPDFYRHFGTLLVDEAHRMPAETWLNVPSKFPGRYRVAATATPTRRDKMHDAFLWHVGPIAVELPAEVGQVTPHIYIAETDVSIPPCEYTGWVRDLYGSRGWKRGPSKSLLESRLAEHGDRNDLIAAQIVRACRKGRRILVLADRLTLLEGLAARLTKQSIDAFLYTRAHAGGAKSRALHRHHQVLLATGKVAQEGMDIPELDTLFLAGVTFDKNLLTQSIGRICRIVEGKPEPIVIDIADVCIPLCADASSAREKLYRKQRWPLDVFHLGAGDA